MSASLYQSVILSGSPSRKRLQRYALFPVPQLLYNYFLKNFWRNFANHWKQDSCRKTFFEASGNRWKRPYIMYFARAHACARICTCRWKKRQVHVKQTGRDLRLHTEKNRLNTENKQCPGDFTPQAHFFPRLPAFSMFSFRETYVSAVENVRFPTGKHTFLVPET